MLEITYKGDLYIYEPDIAVEPGEVQKIFHEVYIQERDIQGDKVGQKKYICNMPMSPYCHVATKAFKMWIECGMPDKKELNIGSNAYNNDIIDYYDKWLDNKIDAAILGST